MKQIFCLMKQLNQIISITPDKVMEASIWRLSENLYLLQMVLYKVCSEISLSPETHEVGRCIFSSHAQ